MAPSRGYLVDRMQNHLRAQLVVVIVEERLALPLSSVPCIAVCYTAVVLAEQPLCTCNRSSNCTCNCTRPQLLGTRGHIHDSLRLLAAGRGRSFLSAFTLRVMPLSDTVEQKRPARRVMPLVLVEYSGLLHASTAAICVE